MTCLKPKLLWRKSEYARAETTIDHSTNELNSEDTVDSGMTAAVDVPGGPAVPSEDRFGGGSGGLSGHRDSASLSVAESSNGIREGDRGHGQGGAGECVCTPYVALTTRLNRFSSRCTITRHGFLFFTQRRRGIDIFFFFPHGFSILPIFYYNITNLKQPLFGT